ncbi:hybrid sensor histidine kinase/response regulator [Geomonas azotofigens]|uniref:hybrid sensor histidine kinase/response regulator n=1 Tax=Geomonas azotofigens TaxID=2843196 RepID=UPI001C124FFC|nr:cache domain-containing protein [Geomonas azotofigens]MBU5612835.1 PAS domain S-box protein [Geomonas azotofigens]
MNWLKSLPIHLLIAFMLTIMALPSVALIIYSGMEGRSDDLRISTRATTYLLDNISSELNSKVEASRQMMEVLSLMPQIRHKDAAAVGPLLAGLLKKFPGYANIMIVDRSGMTWATAVPTAKPVSLADRKAFRDAKATGRFSTGEYTVGKASKKPILNLAYPLRDDAGAFDGAILLGVDLTYIGTLLQASKLPAGTSFGIFDHNGIFLYRTVDPDKYIGTPDRSNQFEKMKNGPETGVIRLTSSDGVQRLSAYRKIRLSPELPPYAYIRGGSPLDILLQEANHQLAWNLSVMFLVLVMVFALNIWLSKRLIANRISALETASRSLAAGELQVRVGEEVRGGELGSLGASFDEMADALAFELSQRIKNEDALREKSDLLELAHDAIILLDLDGSIVYWNQGAASTYGYQAGEAQGQVIHTLLRTVFPKPQDEIMQDLLRVGRWEGKLTHTTCHGGEIVVSSRWALQRDKQGRPWRIMEINSDITEREKSQQELLKMQKLESLGVLAGGIAHDFNNILTGIMGNITLAQMTLEDAAQAHQLLKQAEKACQRASELSNQLLTFAKGGKPIKKNVAVRHLVEETVSLVLRGSNVLSVLDLPKNLYLLEVDEGQVHQAFSNIVINALQSMPQGGTFTVAAANVTIEEGNSMALAAGRYVKFSFSDTGCGIAAEDQKRIFDPYFSTKTGGKGLGLSSAHSVIVRHGGYITVRSQPGMGTAFEVFLPAAQGEGKGGEPESPAAAPAVAALPQRNILVMDDEEMIRTLICAILENLGCKVTSCANGSEAISLYAAAKEAGTPFAAVIMDLTIPGGMGGQEAARHILAMDPRASLIVSSGYSNDPVMSDYAQFGFKATMAKPYRASEVAEVLDRVLTST